jgi:erythromycin esterase-like protein
MEALQGLDVQEDNPTLVHLTSYLLALDEQYDRQALELRVRMKTVKNGRKRTYDIEKQKRSVLDISTFSI